MKIGRFTLSDSSVEYKEFSPEQCEEWERAAEQIYKKLFGLRYSRENIDSCLAVLGLKVVPDNSTDLTRAFRVAMFKVHPDHGGTDVAARECLEAYAILKKVLDM